MSLSRATRNIKRWASMQQRYRRSRNRAARSRTFSNYLNTFANSLRRLHQANRLRRVAEFNFRRFKRTTPFTSPSSAYTPASQWSQLR